MACYLPFKRNMDRICQHCGESIVGNTYRVLSEEQGITMLDMIVCSLCFMEAKTASPPCGGNRFERQTNFRSKPGEPQFATRSLVSNRSFGVLRCTDIGPKPQLGLVVFVHVPPFSSIHTISRQLGFGQVLRFHLPKHP